MARKDSAWMKREDLTELDYITPIANLASILRHGILSHNGARGLGPHCTIAKPEVQNLRARIKVPQGLPLHDYVNLYICARNPMLFLRKAQHATLSVLRIGTAVLDLAGVVITDQNAASDYVRFVPSPDGLSIVDRDLTFAEYWTHEDQIEFWRHKSIKCAEVLVPDCVTPRYILGAYVSCPEAQSLVEAMG